MSNIPCDRCGRDDMYIHTDQSVKFDDEIRYLCGDVRGDGCYGAFRRLVTEADNRRPHIGEVPTQQFVKTSDGVLHHLGDEDWVRFRHWYGGGRKVREREGLKGVL